MALLAPFWVLLGALLASLRVLLVALRCLLGLSSVPFGSSWGSLSFLLGALGGPLGHPWHHCVKPLVLFGVSRGSFGFPPGLIWSVLRFS